MKLLRAACVAGLVLSFSSPVLAETAAAPAKPAKAGKQSFGKPFTVAAAAQPVGDVVSKPDQYEGKLVKVTGTVVQVCQKKGCWFEVAQAAKGPTVRIRSADYSIFVPFDAAGRTATVEGTFKSTTLTEEQAKHWAEDATKAGGKPVEVKGPLKEFQLAATAVELN